MTRFGIVKLQVTIGNYSYTLVAVPKPRHFAFNLATAEPNIRMHSFSNSDTLTPPGTQNAIYWYAALRKYEIMKLIVIKKK